MCPPVTTTTTTTTATDRLVYNHSDCFVVPFSRTEQYKYSFFVETVLNWNHLDGVVAGSNSPETFRSKINEFF